jgi:hypothetical protein
VDAAIAPGQWLRIALFAGLLAAAVVIVFDLVVAEPVVDRAVAGEAHHHAPLALPEPFSRSGQRGGLVAGELILGAGVAFLLAGAATFLGPRARSARRIWLLMTAAAIWAVVVLPAIVYPPLPPGVASSLSIGDRQLLYVTVVAVGLGGFAAAAHLWSSRLPRRRVLAAAAILVPAGLAIALLPGTGADTSRLAPGLLTDFRLASIGGELVFWSALTAAGAFLLRRRPDA